MSSDQTVHYGRGSVAFWEGSLVTWKIGDLEFIGEILKFEDEWTANLGITDVCGRLAGAPPQKMVGRIVTVPVAKLSG